MNIAIINGSPRVGGNSDFIMNLIQKSFAQNFFEIYKIVLRDSNINPCIGCDSCHSNKNICPNFDDFSGKIAKIILNVSAIYIISPVYQGGVTGILKNFMDRCEVFRSGRQLKDKLCGGVAIGGYPGGGQELVLMQIQYFSHICAMRYIPSYGKNRSHLGGHCIAYEKGSVERDYEGLISCQNVVREILRFSI